MNKIVVFALINIFMSTALIAGNTTTDDKKEQEIHKLVDKYLQSRESGDILMLKSILTADMDQLVSTGEWRYGKKGAMHGMMGSSKKNPGNRTIKVQNIRFLTSETGIADARYEIRNSDGTVRKMWSTFIVVCDEKTWKITAIRNMKPAK